MSIYTLFLSTTQRLFHLVTMPSLYVAAVVGGLVGCAVGTPVGAFAGGFIGYALKLCNGCAPYSLDIHLGIDLGFVPSIDPSMVLGACIGLVIGAMVGGGITGFITMFKIYKKANQFSVLSHETTSIVIRAALVISIEVATGLLLGAIIGSIKEPGYGSVEGACVGLILMLMTSPLEKKQKK